MTPLERLIKALSKLPGIGEKSATRLSLHILRDTKGLSHELMEALAWVRDNVKFCRYCQNVTEEELCDICQDTQRDPSLVCVVQEPVDVLMIEKTGDFRGRYHVLHGALSPLDGVGPEDIRIQSLMRRLENKEATELVLATNPNPEGEATALYLKELVSPLGLRVTRIASGIPVGGTLEYADAKTLSKAMGNRRDF